MGLCIQPRTQPRHYGDQHQVHQVHPLPLQPPLFSLGAAPDCDWRSCSRCLRPVSRLSRGPVLLHPRVPGHRGLHHLLRCLLWVCGAIKENHCMTLTFAILLGIIFLMEVGAGIAAYKLKHQVNAIINTNMEKGMQNYNQTDYEGVTRTWDLIQRELDCCGTQEYKDWSNATFSGGADVPDSCCLSNVRGCGKGTLSLGEEEAKMKIHTNGCFGTFSEKIQENGGLVGGIGIGIGFLQLLGIIFACYLANTIKKEYETV